MKESKKKNVQITFDSRKLKIGLLSFLISIIILFILQHFGDIEKNNPSSYQQVYPCEKLNDSTYMASYNNDDNYYDQARCATIFTKLVFKNPISQKEYSTEGFEYLIVFPKGSTTGHTADNKQRQKYEDDLEIAKSYENRLKQFYLPSLLDHPIHILILTIIIYIIFWLFANFKLKIKVK